MVNVPLCAGVPERTPVDEFRERPVGSVPLETLHVAVPRMPEAVKVALKATPAVAVFAAGSVAVTTIGNEPVCVVVPERTPVEALRAMPPGSAPLSDQVTVPMPPDCVKVWLKATPAVPLALAGFVTVMALQAMTSVYVGPS